MVAPMHQTGYGSGYSITSGARSYRHLRRKIGSQGTAVQHNFRRTLLVPSREENISNLGAAVQHNFRRTQLLPSREKSISSLGTAVQHNFRRTLLVPSREKIISSLGAAVQYNLAPKCIGCQAKPPEGAMGPAEGAVAPIAPAWLAPDIQILITIFV